MYQYSNMYPTQQIYNSTPQTPMNVPSQQPNVNLSNTQYFQRPIYSTPMNMMNTSSSSQFSSNYSTPISSTYKTPSKLPTPEEIRAKVNLLSQKKMMEQRMQQQRQQQVLSSATKSYKIEETYDIYLNHPFIYH